MPADRQEIHTIAQHMFPGNRNCLLHKYEGAVSMPYGHLVVINKQNMLPIERLLPNPIPENTIKDVSPPFGPQFDTNTQTVHISYTQPIMDSSQCNMSREGPNFHPCDECGLVYGNLYDLHRHIRKCGSEPPTKKAKVESESVDEQEESDTDDVANATYRWMWGEARDQANEGQERREFFKILHRFLSQAIDLRLNKTVGDILDKAEAYINKGWDESKALKMAIRKCRSRFEDLFEVDSDSQEKDTEGETEEEGKEEEEEEKEEAYIQAHFQLV